MTVSALTLPSLSYAIRKLVDHRAKCIEMEGDYVEKG
jgi:hypothetical protein